MFFKSFVSGKRVFAGIMALLLLVALSAVSIADMITAALPYMPSGNVALPDQLSAELSRIRIENHTGGGVFYSVDAGKTWITVGSVIVPDGGNVHTIADDEFTAADWAPLGSVAAVAVNAIHLKAGQTERHAQAFSIHPKEIYISTSNQSYYTGEAAIFTDIAAGTGIFSIPESPRVGDALYRELPDGKLLLWSQGDKPSVSENIVIISRAMASDVISVEFENVWGGKVIVHKKDKDAAIARVYRPFKGTGRFGGTQFQGVSLLRANHPGVICVSTSPRGEVGGFQIVPCYHANEATLDYVGSVSAYMVIGPLNENDSALEGTMPLFNHTFRPGDKVEVRINGVWGPVPETIGLKSEVLKVVEAVRIFPSKDYLPVVNEILNLP